MDSTLPDIPRYRPFHKGIYTTTPSLIPLGTDFGNGVLDAIPLQLDKGTAEEAYVWPYFAGKSLGLLTPKEKVELLRIVTAGDVAEMQEYGNYNFFRVGITPDGRWKFFTAGD